FNLRKLLYLICLGQRKREVTVRCTYTDGGAEAKDLVQGSFRAFLTRELNKDTPGGNSCTWR
ncbi:hypothetical protein HMPREF0372_02095, partial [Flavonifractor plautii ATCC 29863]